VADLARFGLFDKAPLATQPARRLLPRGYEDRGARIFETGGTKGDPGRIVDVTSGTYNLEIYRVMLEARGLAEGDVVAMTPSGPHAYGTFVSRLARTWAGLVFFVDFDPRWVKACLSRGESPEPYIQHLLAQTVRLLESQRPRLLFTTSRLLLRLAPELGRPLAELGLRGVATGGTSCSPEERRYLEETYLEGVQWIDTYGNTLMGHALQGDAWEGCPTQSYYLPPPLGLVRVVDPADWTREVEVGERGRVLLVTLLEDLFIPNLLERDSAVRVGPHPWFPWGGVGDVQPYEDPSEQAAIEGVY
jgi:phenylacetate-coenzyme A ligase PaaK-like adenylate-forming protein